jgi:hypothetical protein
MKALKPMGFDDVRTDDGGVCAGGTEHEYRDSRCLVLLRPVDEEEELLAASGLRTANLRLSCQMVLEDREQVQWIQALAIERFMPLVCSLAVVAARLGA